MQLYYKFSENLLDQFIEIIRLVIDIWEYEWIF